MSCRPTLPRLAAPAIWLWAFCLAIPSAAADQWPCFGADSQRTFASDAELPLPLSRAWSWRPAAAPRPAWPEPGRELHRLDFDYCFQPVISQGLVIFGTSTDDTVRALDLRTGRVRWTFPTGGPVRFAPAVAGGLAYVASDDGRLYCLEVATGKLIWSFRGGPDDRRVIGNGRLISRYPLRSGVLVHRGLVYVTAGMWPSEGVFAHALDLQTADVVWTNDTCGLQYVDTAHTPASALGGVAPQGYLAASDGVLLVPTGRSTPAGFDLATGELLYCNPEVHRHWWPGGTRLHAAAGFFFNPCTQGTFPFSDPRTDTAEPVLFDGTHVYDIRTGEHAKQRFLPATFYRSNPYYRTLARGEDLFTVEPGFVRRVNMREPLSSAVRREVWKSDFAGHSVHSMAWIGKHLLLGERGAVHVYNAETGEHLRRIDVEGEVRGLAAADGRLVVSTNLGELHMLAGGEDQLTTLTTEPSRNSPPVAGEGPDGDDVVTPSWIAEALAAAGIDRGFAVVADDSLQLAVSLARRSHLHVTLAVDSSDLRDRLRRRLLEETDLHGHRLAVIERSRLNDLPPYFANAVVSTTEAEDDMDKSELTELHRLLHPHTGRWLRPAANDTPASDWRHERGPTLAWRSDAGGQAGDAGPIPPSHRAIRGPLEMTWFGGPGPRRMADRHIVDGPRPRSADGRTFVVGAHHVVAVDAFNGTELWSLPLHDACSRDREVRTSKQNVMAAGVSIAVDPGAVRLGLGDGVHLDLDPATGRPQRIYGLKPTTRRHSLRAPRTFLIPPVDEPADREGAVKAGHWGSVRLQPTPEALELKLTARHPPGRLLDRWQLYFDFREPQQRFGLYGPGAFQFTVYPGTPYDSAAASVFYKYFPRWMGRVPRPKGDAEHVRDAEARPGAGPAHPPLEVVGARHSDRSVTRVRIAWSDLEKLVGAAPHSFAFAASLLLDDPDAEPIERTRLFAGESAARLNNGWPVFDLTAESDSEIAAAPATPLLATIDEMPELEERLPPDKDLARESLPPYRIHPLTKRPTRRVFRPAYGCATAVSSGSTAFFRSGSVAWYDYEDDTGVKNVFGVRPGCLYNSSILPGEGLVTYIERSSGCACNYNFQTSFALVPSQHRRNEDWAVYYDRPAELPVRSMNLNFGVPGDRRDDDHQLWLAYPRPSSRNRPALEVPVEVETVSGGRAYHFNSDFREIRGTERPWIYASGLRGVRRIRIQTWPVMTAVAHRIETPPQVDGRLTEPCWDDEDRTRMLPLRFDTPSPYYREYWDAMRVSERQTDWCYLRSDDERLYVAFADTPATDRRGVARPWRANAEGRDSPRTFGDNFYGLAITDDRNQKLLVLAVSASGAAYDAMSDRPAERDADPQWDGEWSHGVVADEEGFSAEMGIPLETLAEAGLDTGSLRINPLAKSDSGAYGVRSTIPMGEFGLKRVQDFVPLGLGEARTPPRRRFDLRLHFAEPDDAKQRRRIFDVRVQGRTVIEGLDVAKQAGGPHVALIKTIPDVDTTGEIVIELVPDEEAGTSRTTPVLSGLELREQGF